jgi:hypothetical protein
MTQAAMRSKALSDQVGTRWTLRIQRTWDGTAVGDEEAVAVTLEQEAIALRLRVDAPFHDDPPPDSDDLWKHEVVELMLVGEDDRYLEIEMSPHGRSLVLFLDGERNVVDRGSTLDYRSKIHLGRWHGAASIPHAWLPAGTNRLNAFAIHGTGPERRYLAWKPTGGDRPDFHRLRQFGSFAECSAEGLRPSSQH